MLTKTFNELFTKQNLLEALENYKKSSEYQEVKASISSGEFLKMLKKGYTPKPLKSFKIPKNNNEYRELTQASLKSKVIQKVLANALNESIKFSDKSYAFRKGKGTLKAIKRTKDFLKKYKFIAKADIDDFFDTIDQEKLIKTLSKIIQDKKILFIISIFLKNGMLKQNRWIDKQKGVYQGDVLSPVLSNIYLHIFDTKLENLKIDFVRFADDMLFFANSKKEAEKNLKIATKILNKLSLNFGDDKSYIASVEDGFEFLGLRFQGNTITMDNNRLTKKLSNIIQKTKKKNLQQTIEFFNEYTDGIIRYYAKILNYNHQLIAIEEQIETILIQKIIKAKQNKTINKKSKFLQLLLELNDIKQRDPKTKRAYIESIINKAYETIKIAKPLKNAQKEISKNKRNFLKEQIKSSEIILNKYGLYLSVSRGKFVLKEYGKVIHKIPINWVTRIIVMTKGTSISSTIIHIASKNKIDIDFINKDKPYAQITYYNNISNQLYLKQLEAKNSNLGFEIAKSIIFAKAKNQINLIKYYARYRANSDIKEYKQLNTIIQKIQKQIKAIKKATSIEQLMGYEGLISNTYWRAFGILTDNPNYKRETQNAPDAINQALNYGYAFIYHRVQSALIKSGLNIYLPFLHSIQPNKPALVFDLVELFRQPIVDREIISILNLGSKLESAKGKLTKKSVKIITQNIQERLATPTKYKNAKHKATDIINDQALELSHTIKGIKKRFKAYIARY